jgi:hypothetical protein
LEAERGQARQRRQDARAVVRVGRMQLEIEQRDGVTGRPQG